MCTFSASDPAIAIQTALPAWLHWLEQCPSTNTWAAAHASELQHGDVVFTRQQTAGRGQQGRTWQAPPGVLTASVVLDSIPVEQLPGLSLAAGLAVIYAIADLAPDLQNLQLKWPNDVMLQERKLAGILCEAGGNRSSRVIVGIGLNRCANFAASELPDSLIQKVISLHQVAAIVPNEFSLLERLRQYLLETAGLLTAPHSLGLTALLPALRQRDFLLGRQIVVNRSGQQIAGEAVGIGDRGELLLRLAEGSLRRVTSGQVLWQDLS
ncbi:MAG: biotin--[acetyl-CoA-carboxylase] ligase [Oscillatoriophycideae cyanobacterium NC_groundwater_1537_Pr4_S-0.65um_50_18]|nr:biotin--[acetyl-CoA-carboxylase] ligase [Oscillatoriophycideae cyanobacterium NC_groundwater_1537_Pr4_S-0.65um_50_18]